ncbi:MAG: R3H domain-containing nucleic acid-binding protein [Patescibacteria group bacterium]
MKTEDIKKELEIILNNLSIAFSEISVENSLERVILSIESKDSPILIGNSGETLSALNHILRKIIEKKRGVDMGVIVDVNGYRKKAEERVKGVASMLGNRALTFKHSVEMDPMPSFERRIVHSVFQDHPNIVTQSEGFGKFRHVILKYVEQKELSLAKESNLNI